MTHEELVLQSALAVIEKSKNPDARVEMYSVAFTDWAITTLEIGDWNLSKNYYRIKEVPRTHECWMIMMDHEDGRRYFAAQGTPAEILRAWDKLNHHWNSWITRMTGTEVSPEELRELVEQSATEGEV